MVHRCQMAKWTTECGDQKVEPRLQWKPTVTVGPQEVPKWKWMTNAVFPAQIQICCECSLMLHSQCIVFSPSIRKLVMPLTAASFGRQLLLYWSLKSSERKKVVWHISLSNDTLMTLRSLYFITGVIGIFKRMGFSVLNYKFTKLQKEGEQAKKAKN